MNRNLKTKLIDVWTKTNGERQQDQERERERERDDDIYPQAKENDCEMES